MLRIYICPKCFNIRMVSRKPDAICFHCGNALIQCDMNYSDYINMTEQQREIYKEELKKRITTYQNQIND